MLTEQQLNELLEQIGRDVQSTIILDFGNMTIRSNPDLELVNKACDDLNYVSEVHEFIYNAIEEWVEMWTCGLETGEIWFEGNRSKNIYEIDVDISLS